MIYRCNNRNLNLILFVTVILLVFILLHKSSELQSYKERMKELDRRLLEPQLEMIKNLCGDLCNLDKEIKEGTFIGSLNSEVNLNSKMSDLFHVDYIRLTVIISLRLRRRLWLL